jgi:hypothetical protein
MVHELAPLRELGMKNFLEVFFMDVDVALILQIPLHN